MSREGGGFDTDDQTWWHCENAGDSCPEMVVLCFEDRLRVWPIRLQRQEYGEEIS